jgi:hypothetical protein
MNFFQCFPCTVRQSSMERLRLVLFGPRTLGRTWGTRRECLTHRYSLTGRDSLTHRDSLTRQGSLTRENLWLSGVSVVDENSDPLAVVCTLPEDSLRKRRAEIHALLESRTALTRHPDGVEMEWRFSEETARSLLDFVLFERTCCKTFAYELSFSPPHSGVTLRLRASSEQVEALQALYC